MENTTVEREDIPFLRECAAYCHKRAAMGWGQKQKDHWHRLAMKHQARLAEAKKLYPECF